MRNARSGLLLVLLAATTGCGAILNGTRQNITATSAPDGATVSTNPGGLQFTTPTTMNLERKNEYTLLFTKAGYRSTALQVQRRLQALIVVLDVLLTGLVGVVVDAATGAWYKLAPEDAVVTLVAGGDAAGLQPIQIFLTAQGDSLRIESSEPGVLVTVDEHK
jgi:hypothetical protein